MKRREPRGGSAYGMPKYSTTSPAVWPVMGPLEVYTVQLDAANANGMKARVEINIVT